MKMKSFALLGYLAVLMLSGIGVAQTDVAAERMQWFKDSKFGMFIPCLALTIRRTIETLAEN